MEKKLIWLPLLIALVSGCAPSVKREAPRAELVNPFIYPAPPDEPRFAFERMIVNNADVTGVSDQDRLKSMMTGASIGSDGLGKPYAIAVHQGRLFVSDTAMRAVLVFDIPEKKTMQIKETPRGFLSKPLGLDVDGKGNVYVADGGLRRIVVFTRDGKFIRDIGTDKTFDRLSSVTVNHDGTRVYAVDIGGVQSENHRVRVFDAQTGEHLKDIGKRGNGPGEFNLPRDVAIGLDGRLYVVDGGNFRVQIFDKDGKYLSSFGKVGKMLGDFARPKEIATDADGNVYVADTAFGNFQIFSPDGDLLMFVGERSEANGPAKYMLPSGIFVDEDRRVYMVDQWFRKIDVFRPYSLPEGSGYYTKKSTAPALSSDGVTAAGVAAPATLAK